MIKNTFYGESKKERIYKNKWAATDANILKRFLSRNKIPKGQ